MKLPKLKLVQLKDYDYSQNGMYFVTICTRNKEHLFGDIVGNGLDHSDSVNPNYQIKLNDYEKIIENDLIDIVNHFSHIAIDKYAIIPNHIHMIFLINDCEKTDLLKINNFIPAALISTSIVYLYAGIALNKATPSFFKWLLFVICLVLYTKAEEN